MQENHQNINEWNMVWLEQQYQNIVNNISGWKDLMVKYVVKKFIEGKINLSVSSSRKGKLM